MRRNRNKSNAEKTGGTPVNHRVGGGLNRLSIDDLNLLLDAAVQILETIGLAEVSPEISDTMCDAGAQLYHNRYSRTITPPLHPDTGCRLNQ